MIMYILASFGWKFIKLLFGLIQLIDSTSDDPTDDLLNLCRPKLEFGSCHEMLDVWPRP